MNYLVTGGSGFIGSMFIKKALKSNSNLKILNIDCLTYASNKINTLEVENTKNYKFKNLNILNYSKLKETFFNFQPDRVIHFAAESHVDNSIKSAESFIQTNINGTYNLLRVAEEFYKKLEKEETKNYCFHHISTDEVFGDIPSDAKPSIESDVYNPSSPYSASKACADHLVKSWYITYGLPYTITYCTNNYGPFQHKEKLIPLVLSKILNEEHIPVYGDGLQSRSWIYVEDHVAFLLKLLKSNVFNSEFNISDTNEITNIQLVQKICNILDKLRPSKNLTTYKDLIKFVDDRLGHDRRYALNSNKIHGYIGKVKKHSFDEGIIKTIKWTLNQYEQ